MGGPIGRWLIRTRNFFAQTALRKAFGDKTKLTPEIHRHYLEPFARPHDRKGCMVFPRQIIKASDWLAQMSAKLPILEGKIAVLFLWGMQDIAFRAKELRRWQSIFPQARTVSYHDAGHFVPEEYPREFTDELRSFLK